MSKNKKVPKVKTLKNRRHLEFALRYIETLDIIESYMEVYNCSRQNAYGNAYTVYHREDVQEYINSVINSSRAEAYSVIADPGRIVIELSKIAYGNYPVRQKLDALRMLGTATGVLVEGNGLSALLETIEEEGSKEEK